MKRLIFVAFALVVVSGCSSTIKTQFNVIADPPDSIIRVVSGTELSAETYTSPAEVRADVPKDPALARKAFVEVSKANYKTATIPLTSVDSGQTMIVKLEKIVQNLFRYRLSYRLVDPAISDKLSFKDRTVAVSLAVGANAFKLQFQNLSPYNARILWERSEYTDPNRSTHRLMHSGIKFQDRNNPIPDQIVASGDTLREELFPIGKVHLTEKKTYEVAPLFPLDSEAIGSWKGKTVNLFIPVEVNRQIIPYNFRIEITDVVKEPIKS